MASPTGKMDVDKSPIQKSRNHSTDTLRTGKSHRSVSRDRKDRRRDREYEDRRRRSRSRDRGSDRAHRSERSRERHKERERDRERRRDRDGDRHRSERPRPSGESRHGHRDRERDRDREDRERERRRKREDDDTGEARDDERAKRKRPDETDEIPVPVPPVRGSPRHERRDRSADRRNGDKPPRSSVGPRNEPDDGPPPRRDRDRDYGGRRSRRPHMDDDEPENRKRTMSPPPLKRPSPIYDAPPEDYNPDEPKEDDSEARSVFVSQLAARLTARDLGYFFEDKLGEGAVMDARIVTDRLSRRSKGIGYVEFRTIELVEKAIGLSGTVVMGLPIMVQLTEAERNKLHPGDGNLNLPPGVTASHGAILYVGSLHFNLTESEIKQVFEPFGELEFVDLHRDPMTGRSKGYAFIQYKRSEDARIALEQMEGFELAGRTLRVNTVHEKGTTRYTQQDSLDESGGSCGNLNAASRQALMQKLARTEQPVKFEPVAKPNIPQAMQSRSVLLKNMFDPEEETEKDWDKDLAVEVKVECEAKYGPVDAIKVEKDTEGEIYIKFDSVDSARNAVQGLNSRWFGGKQVTATFISDAIMQAHQ
ncbi:splicing factor, CC1-like protein [Pluteus cervinus]|uniref:Splicing factor, CC1-like protein n=1 Tax=Pluteus cervinus TaxID=181527 RepID=A0ACD3BHK4_9AGAR|nr:splicing factor, CC1-like protein [Pluteus cervinus]